MMRPPKFECVHRRKVLIWESENPRSLFVTAALLSKSNHFVYFVSRLCPLFLWWKDCQQIVLPWQVETLRPSTKLKTTFDLSTRWDATFLCLCCSWDSVKEMSSKLDRARWMKGFASVYHVYLTDSFEFIHETKLLKHTFKVKHSKYWTL